MMEFLREPPQKVSWEQIAAAVPDEAAAFEAALAAKDIDLEDFCVRWEEACPEEIFDAWERLAATIPVNDGVGTVAVRRAVARR